MPACRRRGERSQTVAKNSQVGRPEGRREAGRRPPPPTGRRWATHVFGNWQVTFDFAWGINSYSYFSATFGLENFSLKYYLVLIFYKAGLGKILLKVSPVRYFSTKDTSKDTVTCYLSTLSKVSFPQPNPDLRIRPRRRETVQVAAILRQGRGEVSSGESTDERILHATLQPTTLDCER